jgi:hypothetical protein
LKFNAAKTGSNFVQAIEREGSGSGKPSKKVNDAFCCMRAIPKNYFS